MNEFAKDILRAYIPDGVHQIQGDNELVMYTGKEGIVNFIETLVDLDYEPKRVYYAHSKHIYGKEQEYRDIEMLKAMGFVVVNPADYAETFQKWLEENKEVNPMQFFLELVDSCDIVAFRAFPDGKIGQGVWKEVKFAELNGIPVFELPTILSTREVNLEDTREYLRQYGER